MIHNWHYDDGKPIYMEAIDCWAERRKPCWRCSWLIYENKPEIHAWLLENRLDEQDYDLEHKFNSGNPQYYLRIYSETLSVAFRLRWL